MLIVYFAGFATAIYALAPGKVQKLADAENGYVQTADSSALRAQQFTQVANAGFAKFLSFAEEKAIVIGKIAKQKLAEQKQKSE